jgi:ATP-dependent Zn protease
MERKQILKIHSDKRTKKVTDDAIAQVAIKTEFFSGSELENIVNEASFIAFKRGRINPED